MDATSYLLGKKAGGGSGTSNYNDLSNKPSINGVTLSGDKSTSDLGIVIPTVPTNVSAFTNDAGYTTNTGTITSVKMNGSTVSSSGEVDLGTVVTDKSDKQDTLVSGTNIKTINNESILGEGNITIGGGSDYEIYYINLSGIDYDATAKSQMDALIAKLPSSGLNDFTKKVLVVNTGTITKNISYEKIFFITSNSATEVEFATVAPTFINRTGQSNSYDVYNNKRIAFTARKDRKSYNYASNWTDNTYFLNPLTNYATPYTPLYNGSPSTKLYTDKTHYENMAGYDATKTQVLKNVNGTLTWVDE